MPRAETPWLTANSLAMSVAGRPNILLSSPPPKPPKPLHVILCDLGLCCLVTRYDKSIRGYVQVMEGDSTSTRMQLPGNERTLCE